MAPGFLSKFIKSGSPTSHGRTKSDASGSSSQSSRKSSSTLPSPDISQQALSRPATPKIPGASLNKPIIKINASAGASKTSLGSVDSGTSSQPIVTVIPPSPRSVSLSSYSDNIVAETSDRQLADVDSGAGELSSSGRTISVTASDTDTTPLPTPTAASTPSPGLSNSQASGSRSRPVSPSTPTVPLPPDDNTSSNMPKTLEPKSQEVRRSPSNRSLNISTNHARAATSPETTRDSGQGENGTIVMTPIVESPTGLKTEFSAVPRPEQANGSASLAPPRDSDAVSLVSTTTNGGTKEKKRPWKKSTTRKPTGLASAIAASGMAMAQPTLSAAQQATFSSATQQARKASIPGSPPYSTRSPPGSSSHVKGKSADFSPASISKKASSTKSGARRTSISVASDNASEYYPEDRPEYYSGLDASSDEDEDEENQSILDEMEDMPVTGFAVASNKRNADFHELFPSIPEGDYLIEDYGCALQRDILVQGRLYISENHICFHANIFGWITDLSIPMYEITHLEKRMTAFVIPNAIQITTRQAKYTFASFLSRDTTYDVIYNIWRLARPDDGINSSRPSLDGASIGPAPSTIQAAAVAVTGALMKAPKVTMCACSKEGGHYSETALDCILPGTPERIHNLVFASGFIKDFMAIDQKLLDIQMSDWLPTAPGSNLLTRNMSYIKPLNASVGPKSTKCEIRDEMVHNDPEQYISTVTTTRTPDVPSGGVFSVKTRTCVMWASSVSTRLLVTTQVEWTGRSFIRSIIEKSAIDGQKTYHSELEKAMRKYIQEHQSEFIPEGIDASVLPEVAPVIAAIGAATASTNAKLSSEEENKRREQERNQRGLQWAWDTFEGASQVAIRSTKGALELIRDAWEQSSSTTIMWFVIVALIISNLWSLILMGSREEAGRRKEMRKMEEREKWVQGVVTSLWDELSKQQQSSVGESVIGNGGGSGVKELPLKEGFSWVPGSVGNSPPSPSAWKKEVGDMQDVLDKLEERVKIMKESLREVREAVIRLDEVD